ncbi:coiled-coil domain-containing protein 40, partial [Austrofundulus limnaeus]|uniref:Coiled-coil domain-containing protein 40 n=1 Tax=Austrofundulus limnaeus TaxID=52670 RepID=A0A2I4C1T7_AUSLI
MQSSSEERQRDDDDAESGDEEAAGTSHPLPAQDLLATGSDVLDPQPDSDLCMAAPTPHLSSSNTPDVMTDPELPEEKELPSLDPDHPMCIKFQEALNRELKMRLEKIKKELKEKRARKKAADLRWEKVSIEARHVQEKLEKVKRKMEQVQQAGVDAQVRRRQAQDQLEVAKIKFSDVSKQRSQEEAHVTELQGKLEKMLQHLSLAQAVSKDQRSKGKTMKKAKHRAGAEKTQAEEQKLKKDLYITHLTKDLERLTQQVHMYEAQKTAQAVETKAVKQAFSEAEMKLESLMMSRKQMLQEWSNILTSTRSQYEDICAMQEAVCSAENQVYVQEKEIEFYKKATAAEEEKNETLTAQLKCCETDCATSKRLIQQKQAEHEALQAKYSACVHSLQETQHTVSTLTKESDIYQTELDNQKKELEKEKSVLLELEDKIQSNIQQQLGHSKAAQNSQQHIRKMAALKKDKRLQLQQLENDMTSVEQESQKINEHLSSLALIQEALDEETDKYNKLLTSTQTRFSTSARLIDQKQATILNLKAKISKITASTKRDDLGPLHIKVQEMTAQIKELNANIKKGQQLWLLQQEKLLGLIKDLESKSWMMHTLQTQHTAMKQKKIYKEREREAVDIQMKVEK